MKLRRWMAASIATWVMVPMLAAGRPACCAKPSPVVQRACCAAPAVTGQRGCCKPPAPPKQESGSKETLTGTLTPVAPVLEIARAASTTLAAAEMVRLLGAAPRAPSPDDSPPDLIALHHALLI